MGVEELLHRRLAADPDLGAAEVWLVEVLHNLSGGEETLHVVLSAEDGLFAVYQDADWSYSIREGEALSAAVQALLPA